MSWFPTKGEKPKPSSASDAAEKDRSKAQAPKGPDPKPGSDVLMDVPLPEPVASKWREGLGSTMERAEQKFKEKMRKYEKLDEKHKTPGLVCDKVGKGWKERPCHWLERFHLTDDKDDIKVKVKFDAEGDQNSPQVEVFLKDRLNQLKEKKKDLEELKEHAAKVTSITDLCKNIGEFQKLLPRWNLNVVQLQGSNLGGAQLQCADLHGAQLQGAGLYGAHLQGADLRCALLQGAWLFGAQLQGAKLIGAQLQGADLNGAQLQGANLNGAQLQGANLKGAQLQGADLRHAQFQGADLEEGQLQGANLSQVQLQGARLHRAQVQGADLTGARLQGADLGHAQLQDARLVSVQLQGADLTNAKLQGAVIPFAQLQGAKLLFAELSKANLSAADVTGANFSQVRWQAQEAPDCHNVKCDGLKFPKFTKKVNEAGVAGFQYFAKKMFKGPFGMGEEDSDEEAEDDKDGEDEEKEGQETKQNDENADESASSPLLGCCGAEGVRDTPMKAGNEVVLEVADQGAEEGAKIAAENLAKAMKAAQDCLKKTMNQLDKLAQPQAQALRKILDNKKYQKLLTEKFQGLGKKQQDALLKTMENLSKTTADQMQKELSKFEDHLNAIGDDGLSPLLAKLASSTLQSATGYSSGELFAFLKTSPLQMASDQRELEQVENYMEKLQETVNNNNWDDVVDNFLCFYDMQHQLKGERSRQIFMAIWKDEKFRKMVNVGVVFQEVAQANNPPSFVLHEVKDAVAIVKKNVGIWKTATRKEIAAIDIMKGRQAAFFQLMISCISGFFMFVATFFSGLLLDAMREGRVTIPIVSNLLGNSTDAVG